jgi:hypothetical protein
MSDLFALFIIIVAVGLFVALIIYIFRWLLGGIRTSKRDRTLLGGKGWYFISKKQTPRWLRHKWSDAGIDWSHGTVTEVIKEARDKHYEYKLVVVDAGHTHDCAIIRRRLRGHRR